MSKYVMDACALLAFINDEIGAGKVEEMLEKAQNGEIEIYMNKVNLLEIYYGIYREEGAYKADETYQLILKQVIYINDKLSENIFKEAGRLKAKYKISLADAIVLGESIIRKASVLSSDHHEFDILEQKEDMDFDWIR